MCFYPKKINGQYVACRHCIDCRLNKAREWSFRVAAEASLYDQNCMITLTYSDEFLPPDKKVDRRAIQLFMKRLRKAISPAKVRFFACGEYGARFSRPHYHVVLFGFQPDDLVELRRDGKGTMLYRSALIERLWTFGFSSVVTDVNLYVARYVAKYMQKDKQGFITMSRRPALGFGVFSDDLLSTDKIYVGGAFTRLPRVFLDNAENRHSVDLLKQRRRDRLSEFHTLDDHGYPVFSPELYSKFVADRRDRFFDRFPEFK